MREETLRDYFEGTISTDILYMELEESEIKTSYDVTSVHIDQLKVSDNYLITKQHLLKLCTDALLGNLKPSHLTTITFALVFSEYFDWDEEDSTVKTTIFDWDNPDINFPMTADNIKKWKVYLETGKYLLS